MALKSEVAHHTGETGSENVTAPFNTLLTLLTLLGGFQALQQLFKFIDIKVVVGSVTSNCHDGTVTNELIIRDIFLETKRTHKGFIDITLCCNLLDFLGTFVLQLLGFLIDLTLEIG